MAIGRALVLTPSIFPRRPEYQAKRERGAVSEGEPEGNSYSTET